jgi:DNA polymerase III delta subunit
MELDKLALYRDTEPISVEDVRALVPEALPGSIWAFVDAVGERETGSALGLLERLLAATAEPVLVVVLHRRVRELLELGDRLAAGANLATAARAMGINSEYRAGMLAAQARNWTTAELAVALDGLVEVDGLIKGAPGPSADAAQRRLAFTLWVMDHTTRRERRTA